MRTLVVIVGISLILVAAVLLGKMLGSDAPFEPLVPCALGAFGFGIFGFGLFIPSPSPPAGQCPVDRSEDADEAAAPEGE